MLCGLRTKHAGCNKRLCEKHIELETSTTFHCKNSELEETECFQKYKSSLYKGMVAKATITALTLSASVFLLLNEQFP